MATPIWPVSVPHCPMLGSVQISRTVEPPVRSEMNSGTTRQRRKFTFRIAQMSFSLRLNNTELDDFIEFHEVTLADGAARFEMPVFYAGTLTARRVMFMSPPSYQPIAGNLTRVDLSLMVENYRTGIPDPNAVLLPDGDSYLLLP